MNHQHPYSPPQSPLGPPPRGGRERLRPVHWFQLFMPSIICVATTFVPVMLKWTTGAYPFITSGLAGIFLGVSYCLITGVQFGLRMKTGPAFLSVVLWLIIVTTVNAAVAWGGCAAGLSWM